MPPPLAARAKNFVPMIGPAGTAHRARVHSPVSPRAIVRGGAKSACRSAACASASLSTISFQSSTCCTVSSETKTVLAMASSFRVVADVGMHGAASFQGFRDVAEHDEQSSIGARAWRKEKRLLPSAPNLGKQGKSQVEGPPLKG